MKKIVFLSLHPGFGGAATANAAIISMLSGLYDIYFIDEFIKPTVSRIPPDVLEKININSYPLSSKRFEPYSVSHIINDISPDYIIVLSPFLLIYYSHVLFGYRQKGVNLISIHHSLTLGSSIKSKFIDFIQSLGMMVMNKHVYVSFYTKKMWEKYVWIKRSNIQRIVIYNSVGICEKKNNIKSCIDKIRIGYVGRLSKEKNPILFAEIAKYFKSNNKRYDFIIYGDGSMMDNLKHKYSDYIDFKGLVNNVKEIYEGIDILVMTSDFENCPMAILEAKKYGVPAVAPHVGGIPEIIVHKKTGFLVDDYEIKSFEKGIMYIINKYFQVSAAVYEDAINYSDEEINKRWFEIMGR